MRKCYLLLLSLVPCFLQAQNLTNTGKDFWVGYGPHQFMESGQPNSQEMVLYLSTGDTAAIVVVKIENSGDSTHTPWTRVYNIPANTVISTGTTPAVSWSPATIGSSGPMPKTGIFDSRLWTPPLPAGSGCAGIFQKRAIHITSNVPIVAYAHIYGSASSGASMLLPGNTWGFEYKIINSNQQYASNCFSWFYVMAKHDNTRIRITVPVKTRSMNMTGLQVNIPREVVLNAGEIYQVAGANAASDSMGNGGGSPMGFELTGSTITSIDNGSGVAHPIAVFAGSSRTDNTPRTITSTGGTGDNDIQQVFPVQSWGKQYLTAPTSSSSNPSLFMKNLYKIIVADPTTIVRRNGSILGNLINGSYYYFESSTADFIDADKPIMVAQFMTGTQGYVNGPYGDPEMMYLSPVEQGISKTRFYRNNLESINYNYVTLIIPTAGLASLKVDGILYNPLLDMLTYTHPVVPGYSVFVKRWPAGTAQCVVESDSTFTGITYGLGSVESYGYNIGASYDSINPHSPRYNVLKGDVFYDNDRNGIRNGGEPLYRFAKLESFKALSDTFSTITADGRFYIYLDTGSYVTKVYRYLPYFDLMPLAHTSTFPTYGNQDSVQFAVQPIPGKRDLGVFVIPLDVARPGFLNRYKMVYTNLGTDTTNGTVTFVKDARLSLQSVSLAPASVSGDTLRWNFSNLRPTDTTNVYLNFMVAAPPACNLGDTLVSTATIWSNASDLDPANNVCVARQIVRNAYDPNDKREIHGGRIDIREVLSGEYLQYTIRFQNTGNDTAFNVYLKDTLDLKLDWNTMRILDASHTFQMTISDGRYCSWNFNHIMLPDSATNPAGSQGYVVFIIKPKQSVGVGDVIRNKVSIYFDANLPVVTNTERTLVVSDILPVSLLTFTAEKTRQGNQLKWMVAREIGFSHYSVERSTDGRAYGTIGTVASGGLQYSFIDREPTAGLNFYRLKMVDKDGRFSYSPVRVLDNSGTGVVTVYPNPATDQLMVNIEATQETEISTRILSVNGVTLMSRPYGLKTGKNTLSMRVSTLPPGQYLLQVHGLSGQQYTVKFTRR